MPSLDPEKPGIATKGVYDSAFIHSGGCRLFIMGKSGQVGQPRAPANKLAFKEEGGYVINLDTTDKVEE